jgi:hypothetical protein
VAKQTKFRKRKDFFKNIRFLQDQVFEMKNPIKLMLFLELMELIHHEKQLAQDIYLHMAKLVLLFD